MKRFTRDVVIIAAATAVSRVFGLVRDIVIADRFGAGDAYDAYLIAFFIPHFLRRLLGEGALALSFIPVYTEYLNDDKQEADKLASNTFNILLLMFPLIIVVGILLSPYYIPFLAGGFSSTKLHLTIELTRIIFPFIGFIGLAAFVMGILNAKKHFFAPAFAPVLFNVGVISGALWLGNLFARPVFGLAAGVVIGGLGQLSFQIPYLKFHGFDWSLKIFPLHPGLKKAGRLMLPVVIGLIAAQVNIMVDNKLASHLSEGSISVLQYATRLFQLPLGLFTVAISTAILPRLSAGWSSGRTSDFTNILRRGLTVSFMIMIPAAVGLWIMGTPIIRTLFQHHQFTAQDTARTASVLNFYLIGLIGYSLVHLFTRAFYSIQRTYVPVLAGMIAVGVNVGMDLLLLSPMGLDGLAMATAVSGLVNGGILVFSFARQSDLALHKFLPSWKLLVEIIISAGVMGLIVLLLKQVLAARFGNEYLTTLFPVVVGIGCYGVLGLLFDFHKLVQD